MSTVLRLPFGDGQYECVPSKVIALGLNYRAHIQESESVKVRGFDPVEPDEPILFPKLPSAIIGDRDEIVLPAILGDYRFEEERTDYEGEIAVIIGRGGRDIDVGDAVDHILGLTCANDVSQRNIQNGDRSGWFRGKSFDTFLPLGPRLVPIAEIGKLDDLAVETRLNGRVVQSGSSGRMIFPIAETISFISRNFTLNAGDVVLTGTPAGVGPLAHGDRVEVEVDRIGTLTNTVRDARIS